MFNKYLKYKNKYLELKKNRVLKGGAATVCADATCSGYCNSVYNGSYSKTFVPPLYDVDNARFSDARNHGSTSGLCLMGDVPITSTIRLDTSSDNSIEIASLPLEDILQRLYSANIKKIINEASQMIDEESQSTHEESQMIDEGSLKQFHEELKIRGPPIKSVKVGETFVEAPVEAPFLFEPKLTDILYQLYHTQLEQAVGLYRQINEYVKRLCPTSNKTDLDGALTRLDNILDGILNIHHQLPRILGIAENPQCELCKKYCYSIFCEECIINYNPHDMATDPLDLSMAVLPKRPCPRSFGPDTYPLGSLSYELPEISQKVLDKIGAVDVIEKSIYKGIFIYKKWLKLEIIFIYRKI